MRSMNSETIRENDCNPENCFDPIFLPPESFLEKIGVPTFYAIDENGVEYFYHGKTRIRVSEHFAKSGRTYGEIAADTIRYVTGSREKKPLSPAC